MNKLHSRKDVIEHMTSIRKYHDAVQCAAQYVHNYQDLKYFREHVHDLQQQLDKLTRQINASIDDHIKYQSSFLNTSN